MNRPHYIVRTHCPACRSTGYTTLYTCSYLDSPMKEYLTSYYGYQGGVEFDYLEGMEYQLVECRSCGLFYQLQILDDFLLQKLYDEWIDPEKALKFYLEKQNLKYYIKYAREIIQLITYFGTRPDQLHFLDFGMGWGYWCRMAASFGVNVFGAELSATRIAHAANFHIPLIDRNAIPGSNFDFINTEQVLEHLVEPLETLQHLKKGLKPGGLIKLSVPNCSAVKKLIQNPDWTIAPGNHRNKLKPVTPLEHLNGFTYSSLVRIAAEAGLEEVRFPLSLRYAYLMYSKPVRKPVLPRLLSKQLLIPLREHRMKNTYLFFQAKE